MKKNTEKLFAFILIIAGIAVAVMMFLPTLAFPDSDTTFTGFEVIFGTEFVNLGSFASGEINLSIWGILAYSLPLIAGLITIFYRRIEIAAIILFIIGTVLLITLPSYIVTTITVLNTVTEIDIEWVTSYGLLLAIGFAVLGVITSLFTFISKKQ